MTETCPTCLRDWGLAVPSDELKSAILAAESLCRKFARYDRDGMRDPVLRRAARDAVFHAAMLGAKANMAAREAKDSSCVP